MDREENRLNYPRRIQYVRLQLQEIIDRDSVSEKQLLEIRSNYNKKNEWERVTIANKVGKLLCMKEKQKKSFTMMLLCFYEVVICIN